MTDDEKPAKRRGYVRPSRLHAERDQIKAMEQDGVQTVYVEGPQATISDYIKSLRKGDVVCVATMGRLGRTREIARLALTQILEKGASIRELKSGRTLRTQREIEAAIMGLDAADEISRDARAPTQREARRRGKLGAEALRLLNEAKRMPTDQASMIWHNNSDWSNDECLEKMTGWTLMVAYRKLGKRGLAKGRPSTKKPKK